MSEHEEASQHLEEYGLLAPSLRAQIGGHLGECRACTEEVKALELALEVFSSQPNALELAYFEGLTQSEIAERTGAPLGTVKTRTRQALRKMSELLADGARPTASG